MRITNMEVFPNPDTFAPEMHVTLAFPMELVGSDEEGKPHFNQQPVIHLHEDDFMDRFREALMLYKDNNDE